jgi:chromosome segregation ATPase
MQVQQRESAKVVAEVQTLRNELERSSAALGEQQRRADLQRRENDQLRVAVENLQTVVKRRDAERAEQIDQITDLELALSSARDSADPGLPERAARTAEELVSLKKQLSSLTSQCEAAKRACEDAEQRARAAQSQLESATSQKTETENKK